VLASQTGKSDRGDGLAVFAMHPEAEGVVSAVTVVPTASGDEAEITNLKEPGGSYTVSLGPRDDEEEEAAG
jgi:hypothetical protein